MSRKLPATPARSRRHQHVHLVIPAMQAARRSAGRVDHSKGTKPKLVGYYSAGKVPNRTRQAEVDAWKDHLREHVQVAMPSATKDRPVRVDAFAFYPDWGGSDPENIRKLAVDVLFPSKHSKNAVLDGEKTGDKYVYGYHERYQVDAARPRLELVITWEEDTEEDPQ